MPPGPFPEAVENAGRIAKAACEPARGRRSVAVQYAAWPAMDHVERTIFSNPRTMTPARRYGRVGNPGRRAADRRDRIDRPPHQAALARRRWTASRGADEYVRPGQIAVVFRRPQPLADLVSEVFQRLEIPFFMENGRSLSRCPAIVMLLRLLELDADDWPMYKLLGVLGNNYFARIGPTGTTAPPAWPSARSAVCRSLAAASGCWSNWTSGFPSADKRMLGCASTLTLMPSTSSMTRLDTLAGRGIALASDATAADHAAA